MSFQARACTVLLGAIFLVSAFAKAGRPKLVQHFLEMVHLPNHFGFVMALVVLEFELGWRWIMGWSDRITIHVTLALLLTFILLLLMLIKSGERVRCSCYGNWARLTPIEAFKLDVLYLGVWYLAMHGQHVEVTWVSGKPLGFSLLLILWMVIHSKVNRNVDAE